MNNNLQNSIFQAMQQFADYSADNVTNTRMVEATIIDVIDASIGKYLVDYLSNKFEVFASNIDTIYSKGENVYIVVPNGDFSLQKFILNSANPNANNIIDTNAESNSYYNISENLITLNNELVQFNSYQGDQTVEGYIQEEDNLLNFSDMMAKYLELENTTFRLSCSFKNNFETDHKGKGNFGIRLDIPVVETESAGEVKRVRSVIIDTSNINADPYNLTAWFNQEVIFNIADYLDADCKYDFDRLPSFTYFCEDFTEGNKTNYDIFIKEPQLYVVNSMGESGGGNGYVYLTATQGPFFTTNFNIVKTITPTLKINGKDADLTNASIFWFMEDASVNNKSPYYNDNGGYGWKILNTKNTVVSDTDGSTYNEYDLSQQILEVKDDDVLTENTYKCVIKKDGIVISGTITLYNLKQNNSLTLETETLQTSFLKNSGDNVRLHIKTFIDGITNDDTKREEYRTKVTYSFIRYDKKGNTLKDHNVTIDKTSIPNYPILLERESYYLQSALFPVNYIDGSTTIAVSAYIQEDDKPKKLIGTAKLLLTTNDADRYIIELYNANEVYKYDTDGDSPFSSEFNDTGEVVIKPIEYKIFYPNGKEFSENDYHAVKAVWTIPKNSMFMLYGSTTEGLTEDNDNWYITQHSRMAADCNLIYKIAERYNKTKAEKQITLTISWKDIELSRSTNILFIKEGQQGTNGTIYAGEFLYYLNDIGYPFGKKLEKVDNKKLDIKLKICYNINDKKLYWFNYETGEYVEFITKLEEINLFTQVFGDNKLLTDNTQYTVKYTMFDEKYLNPCLTCKVGDWKEGFGYPVKIGLAEAYTREEKPLTITTEDVYCNIIQAEIEIPAQESVTNTAQKFYCYYPIDFTVVNSKIADFNINVPIINITDGFSDVMFAADGTNPQYVEEPFNLALLQKLNVQVENPTYKELEDGQFNTSLIYSSHLIDNSTKDEKENPYTIRLKPKNKYDDGETKNYIQAIVTIDESKIEEYTQLKTEAEVLKTQTVEQLSKAQEMETDLTNFAKNAKYDDWVQIINDIAPLAEHKNAAYNAVLQLILDCSSIIDYLNNQNIYFDNRTIVTCSQIFEDEDAIIKQAEKVSAAIQAINGEQERPFYNISEIKGTMTWDDAMARTISSVLGNGIKDTLRELINSINKDIINCNNAIIILLGDKDKDYLTKHAELLADIDAMCGYIDNNEDMPEYYKSLSNYCKAYKAEFKTSLNLEALKITLENFKINVLEANINETNDGLIEGLAEEQKQYQQSLLNKIADLNAEIEKYTNLIQACENGYKATNTIPIVFYFNRYGMSNINGWDGNKLETGDGNYLLAPQVGSGVKEDDNSFTGIVIGQRNLTEKVSDASDAQVGLFGYNKGQQSIFMNARNGSAIFGSAGAGGQIIIDPAKEQAGIGARALLFSSNFFKEEAFETKSQLPTQAAYEQAAAYMDSHTANPGSLLTGDGMCIDLSTPGIAFGNGAFRVGPNGEAHIGGTGKGDLGGWNIEDDCLKSANWKSGSKGAGIRLYAGKSGEPPVTATDEERRTYQAFIHFGDSDGYLYSGNHYDLECEEANPKGFYLGSKGFSISSTFTNAEGITEKSSVCFKVDANPKLYTNSKDSITNTRDGFYIAGDGIALGKYFKVDNTGKLTLGKGAVDNSTTKHWTISAASSEDNSYISYNRTSLDSYNSTSSVYMGTDGIGLGNKFKVTNEGVLKVGNLSSNHWTIDGGAESYIAYGNVNSFKAANSSSTNPTNTVYIGTNGVTLGSKFSVDRQGNLVATSANISGKVIAKEGEIGGCTISGGVLKIKNANIDGTIDAGHINTTNLKVKAGNITGTLTANQIDATDLKVKAANITGTITAQNLDAGSGKIAGWKINSTSISKGGTTLSSSSTNGKITTNNIEATGGKIGGWSINSTSLQNGANVAGIGNVMVSLNSTGSIRAQHVGVETLWELNNDGTGLIGGFKIFKDEKNNDKYYLSGYSSTGHPDGLRIFSTPTTIIIPKMGPNLNVERQGCCMWFQGSNGGFYCDVTGIHTYTS